MFERFAESARQVVVLAQDEARLLKHNYVGTEHILLGLLREEEGLAARALESLDVTLEEVRAQVARIIGEGDEVATGQIPFTPRTKKVLELSLREALHLGHNYIGTEHLLLGLARENEGVAARILLDLGVDHDMIRSEILRMLSGPGAPPPPEAAEGPKAALLQQLTRVRDDKEAALEAQDYERAAALRDSERSLVRAIRAVEGDVRPPSDAPVAMQTPRLASIVAVVLAAAGFPLGLLVGWLIWA